jgi:hypothetical protein
MYYSLKERPYDNNMSKEKKYFFGIDNAYNLKLSKTCDVKGVASVF